VIEENVDRNAIIHQLWENGDTIDDIAFDTGIPRSTVGYYVRKFNKKAKRGEPIRLPHIVEKPSDEALAQNAFYKGQIFEKLNKYLEAGDIDTAYKFLMIIKLNKELQSSIIPTKEESQAGFKAILQFAQSRQRSN